MQTRKFFLAALILLLASAVRLYNIQAQSIWFDEGWSAYAAAQPTFLDALRADATNPPLYYLLLNVSARVFGDSPFGLRFFSLLMGLVAIPLAYQLGRRLFDEHAALYAAFVTAVLPLLWWAAQEARMYTLLAVLLLAVALAFHRLLQGASRWAWAALVISETLLLYAHNTGPIIVLWLNAAVALAWLSRRSAARPNWRMWIAGQIAAMLLWLPWFLARFLALQAANSAVTTRPELGAALLGQIWQAFWAGPWSMVGRDPVVAASVVILVLWLAFAPWRQAGARWLLVHLLLLTGGLLLGLIVLENELHGRYLAMSAPLLAVSLGAGIARLSSRLLRYGLCALLAGWLFVVIVLTQNPEFYQHDDARGMVQYYADRLTDTDSVLAWSYADRYDLWYYWDRLGAQARRITLPEGADLQSIVPLLPTSGDVALNVWYTQRADYRGMMNCVLGHGTVNLPEAYTVYGMSSLLFESPRLRLPALRLPALRESAGTVLINNSEVARVDLVGEFPDFSSDQALCLPIHLSLIQPIDADLKAALIIRNRFGREIARADAPFATANQRTTSQLLPGESVTAYPLIRLPFGAPPRDYEVILRIYDEQRAQSGFDLSAPQTRFATKDLPLGLWRVVPGADWPAVRRNNDLLNQVNITVNQNLTLLAHDAPNDPGLIVNNGTSLPMTLLWSDDGPLPDLELAAVDETWRISVPALEGLRDSITLDWRNAQIPPQAASGPAELRLPNGTVIGRFQVEALPFLAEEPEVAVEVRTLVPGIGTLIGFTLDAAAIDRSRPLPVTLIWQAGSEAIPTSYTVFIQLLDADGVLIAQSDAVPAQKTRPTSGWRPSEYIVDAHELTFNAAAAPGPATLIVGLYDPVSTQRVVIGPDDADFITLPVTLDVR